jgi:hypothetical protein
MKPTITIMRGLPGSGKSHRAKKLVLDHAINGVNAVAISTDDYFMAGRHYLFSPQQLPAAHAWNLDRCSKLIDKKFMRIVVDNTHTQLWEMTAVVDMGLKAGYEIEFRADKFGFGVSVAGCTRLNKHGVPEHAIQRMSDRWEELPATNFMAAILNAKRYP